jgi:hypothetical protein
MPFRTGAGQCELSSEAGVNLDVSVGLLTGPLLIPRIAPNLLPPKQQTICCMFSNKAHRT